MAVVKIQSIHNADVIRGFNMLSNYEIRSIYLQSDLQGDLKKLFRSETSRMEEAVAVKDFRAAADLEARL